MLRNWHRWLSVLVGLFVLFQGLTGAVSQQRFALLAASEPDVYAVSRIDSTQLSPSEIIVALKMAKPDFRPAHVMLPMDNSPGTAAIVMGGRKPTGIDMSRSITVDQYSGAIITERSSSDGWVGAISGLHKWAGYGISGRVFVIVFGLVTTAFMLTGLTLWLRSRRYATRIIGMARIHRSAGFLVGIVLAIVSLTGVLMSLATWQERTDGTSVVAMNMRAGMRETPPLNPKVDLSQAWDIATQQVPNQRLAAFSDAGPHAAQYWFAFTDTRLRRTDVLVNPQTAMATVYPSGVTSDVGRLRGWLYSVHTGYVFGEAGGFVMTIVGMALFFWPVSGFLMWRRRRKRPVT